MEPTRQGRFEDLMLPHLDAAYTLAHYLLRDDENARDVTQEAMLRAVRHFDGYRGGDARAWLLAIVRNTAHSWHRRHRSEGRQLPFDEELHSEEVGDNHPEALVIRAADRERMRRALDQLPPEFREVIVLRELQDLSYKEIAAIIAAPVGTVMSRLARARARLERLVGRP